MQTQPPSSALTTVALAAPSAFVTPSNGAPVLALLGLGSNMDEPVRQLSLALDTLRSHPAVNVLSMAGLYETEPVGLAQQAWFVNTVVLIETKLSAEALLEALLAIEQGMGRVRDLALKNGPRRIDLDLLLYGDQRQVTASLTLPHPRMHQRAFVLLPLLELLDRDQARSLELADWMTRQLGQSPWVAYQALGQHEQVRPLAYEAASAK